MLQNSEISSVEEDLTLLDIALVLAESWRLLLLVPLAIGLLVAGGLWSQTPTPHFVANAEIWISDDIAQAIHSESFLKDVASQFPVEGDTLTWQDISAGVSLSPPHLDQMGINSVRTLAVRWADGEHAEAIFNKIAALIQTPTIEEVSLDTLKARLETYRLSKIQIDDAITTMLHRLDTAAPASAGEEIAASLSIIDLVRDVTNVQLSNDQLLGRINSWPDRSLKTAISVAPESLDKKWAIAGILSAFAAGFVLMVFVFVRAGVRRAARSETGQQKFARLGAALRMRKQPD